MARPFIPDPDAVEPGFPAEVFSPWPVLDRKADHADRTENFTWPGVENDYTIRLDFAILDQVSLAITGGGDELLPVRWTDAPGPGEVAVLHGGGLLRCNAALAGSAGSCVYTPLGSAIDAQWQATVQQEIKAAQQAASNPVVDGGTW